MNELGIIFLFNLPMHVRAVTGSLFFKGQKLTIAVQVKGNCFVITRS